MPNSPQAKVELPDQNGTLTDYSDRLESVEIEDAVEEQITTFDMSMTNADGALNHLSADDQVKIYFRDNPSDSWTLALNGLISAPKDDVKSQGIKVGIEGGDYAKKLQDATVTEVYTDTNVRDIILDFMDKEVAEVTTNNVQDPGETWEKIVFPAKSPFDCLQDILDRLEDTWQFWVDNNKDLHFEPRGFSSSGVNLEYGVNISEASLGEDYDEMVNFALVYGKRQNTRMEDPNSPFTASGSEETVSLQYKPKGTKVTNTTTGEVLQGGIEGVQTLGENDVEFLVDFHAQEITWNQGSGDSIEVEYDKGNPVFAFHRDTGSIGKYGEKRKQIMIENIETEDQAKRYAKKIVKRFGKPILRGSVLISGVVGLDAGETVDVNIPSQGYTNETLTVAKARYKYDSSGFTQSLEVGERLARLDNFIKRLENRMKSVEAEMSGRLEIVPKLVFPSDTVEISESGEVQLRDMNNSFILGRNLLGDHHEFATATDQNGEKGFDRGTLSGNAEIDSVNDVVTLSSDNSTGSWEADVLYNVTGQGANSWGTITYSVNEPTDTSITVDVIRESDGQVLASDVASGTDLSTISSTDHEDLTIKVNLSSTSTAGNVPELQSLKVTFSPSLLGDQADAWSTEATF